MESGTDVKVALGDAPATAARRNKEIYISELPPHVQEMLHVYDTDGGARGGGAVARGSAAGQQPRSRGRPPGRGLTAPARAQTAKSASESSRRLRARRR